jgi:hypothetical protein
MKRATVIMLLTALVFGIAATWLGPKMIAYWYNPPVPTAFNCTDAINWAMHRLILTQLGGTAIGLVVGAILGVLMRNKKPAPPTPTATATKPAQTTP